MVIAPLLFVMIHKPFLLPQDPSMRIWQWTAAALLPVTQTCFSFDLQRTSRSPWVHCHRIRSILVPVLAAFLNAAGCTQQDPPDDPKLISASAEEIQAAIRSSAGKAVLVNVWATWCVPCREEFPDILKVYEAYRADGLELVLVSADFESQEAGVEAFLKDHGIDFDTYIKQDRDAGFIGTMDKEWSGALPASWIYDTRGSRIDFWEGKANEATFQAAVLKALGDSSRAAD